MQEKKRAVKGDLDFMKDKLEVMANSTITQILAHQSVNKTHTIDEYKF